MMTFQVKIELLSQALIGSGEGHGAIIDSDIIFDETGLPFIPAKRVKGCLLDAARNVKKMFALSKIDYKLHIEEVFGTVGSGRPAQVFFSDLYMHGHAETKAWLKYLMNVNNKAYQCILSPESILDTFTKLRHQTRINEKGVAADGSLRTSRVIKKGIEFYGDISMPRPSTDMVATLALACCNFRRIGTQRNRGFGKIKCSLLQNGTNVIDEKRLEAICIN